MRETTRKEKLRFLRKWFNEFDNHLFDGYFRDKDVSLIVIPSPDEIHNPLDGCASMDEKEICITEYCFKSCTPYGIREILLHEMIHLFVAYTYPNGKRVWGDECRDFVNCEKNLQKLRVKQIENKFKNR
jgi:hypothetical protein